MAEFAADGLTNREIAQALFVTEKTVETHLGHLPQARPGVALAAARGAGERSGGGRERRSRRRGVGRRRDVEVVAERPAQEALGVLARGIGVMSGVGFTRPTRCCTRSSQSRARLPRGDSCERLGLRGCCSVSVRADAWNDLWAA